MNHNEYNPSEIEKKWQQYWEESNAYKVENKVEGKENFYTLSEFAYPSGNLHVGHWYAFAVPDIYARYKRMNGYNVLYPVGFDSFGLPAENAAIKRGLDPRKWTYENMDYMKGQLKNMGAMFDWDRTLATSDPEYYKWTQWMFTQFYANDLVERSLTKTNWCESCKTVLANEQVVAGKCGRCDHEVIQKDMAQWMLKITEFADELHDDLDTLDWDHSIKQAQREWIGRKEGSLIPFKIQESEVYDVNTGPGDDAFREGEPIVDRNNVVVIIEHPERDEFLCAKWKQVDWQGFVTGGIEDGMSIEETALAEVREETGYQNPEIIKVHDQSSHGLFWHVVKKQNRRANYRIVHVKLRDLEQLERSKEEQAIADFLWVPRAEVNDFLKREDMKYPWRVVSEDKLVFGEAVENSTLRPTVKTILKNGKGEILLLKYSYGYELPGGALEKGETITEAALRELKEETLYSNFRFISDYKSIRVHYLAKEEGINFDSEIHFNVFELEDEEYSERSLADGEKLGEMVWVSPQEVLKIFNPKNIRREALFNVLESYINSQIKVFTTRADTLFGATYVVLAPEHHMVKNLNSQITNWDEVEQYLDEVSKKSDLDRQQSKEKTGVQLKGIEAINPATGKPVSVWIADYVLAHFGTGAVMAVPAHDERDAEFAIKYDLPFKFVCLPSAGEIGNSRPLVTSGENTFILAAGTTEKKGSQEHINAQWNAMYDLLGTIDDGILPVGKRFCCSFEGKIINSIPRTDLQKTIFLGFNHPKKGKIWKHRKRVYALIKQKDKDLYLGLRSLTDNTQGLITGGIDDGEISEQTVIREILEETGYIGTILKKEEYKIYDRYYSTNKDLNIESVGDVFVVEIQDVDEIKKISQQEKDKHKAIWLSKEEYIKFINPPSHKYILSKYFGINLSLDSKNTIQYGNINTKTSEEAQKMITEIVGGEITKTYRLRDWGISRQRYWGCPIPIVYDPEGNPHVVPDEHLPWILPDDVNHTPDGTAPLARSEELKSRTEEIFGTGWTPEVDTMDAFVDSTWYYYRYLDNKNSDEFASAESMKSWMPVDMYFGGAEHTTMHLLYSRFWVKALHKLGLVSHNEPYKGRLNRGLILGPDGAKMSKSKGNVIDPDEVVLHVGADTVRMYLAFIGPYNEPGNYPWDPNGVVGIKRFLERVWRLQNNIVETTDDELVSELHQTIKKVDQDIERLKLNTAISSMMSFLNKAEKSSGISLSDYELFIQILAPFAPHMTEEIWMQNHSVSIHSSPFPEFDESKITTSTTSLPIQINGKVRAEIVVEEGEDSDVLKGRVIALPEIQKWIEGKKIIKFIYVPERIINLVVK